MRWRRSSRAAFAEINPAGVAAAGGQRETTAGLSGLEISC